MRKTSASYTTSTAPRSEHQYHLCIHFTSLMQQMRKVKSTVPSEFFWIGSDNTTHMGGTTLIRYPPIQPPLYPPPPTRQKSQQPKMKVITNITCMALWWWNEMMVLILSEVYPILILPVCVCWPRVCGCFRKPLVACVERQLLEQHLNNILQKGAHKHCTNNTCMSVSKFIQGKDSLGLLATQTLI